MSPHILRLLWLMVVFIAILLGIWPGVALGMATSPPGLTTGPQDHWIAINTLFGWCTWPSGMLQILLMLTGRFDYGSQAAWVTWMISLGYPCTMLGYSACAYRAIRRSGMMRKGLMVSMIAASVSALLSIPAALITTSFDLADYLPLLPWHLCVLINLLISAVLGWLLCVRWIRRHSSSFTKIV